MNVVDSSGWLEYFADGPNVGFFSKAIEAAADLIVPTMSLYQAVATMQQGTVVSADRRAAPYAGTRWADENQGLTGVCCWLYLGYENCGVHPR